MSAAQPIIMPGTVVKVALTFGDLGYVGKPYWPELAQIIGISKNIHPKFGEEKKKQALEAELNKRGISDEQYQTIVQRSQRPFYTAGDLDDGSGEVIIPRHVLCGMMAQVVNVAPKSAVPKLDKGSVHNGLQMVEPFLRTGKTVKDAKEFGRFVKNQESNERRWDSSLYLPNITATGTLIIEENFVSPEHVKAILEYGGRYVGIGSCRGQGFGRFQLMWTE
jgi:hypothetical protein